MSVKNYQVAEGEGAAEKIEDELWNIIVMKYYCYEIILLWNIIIMKYYCYEILLLWIFIIMKYYYH